MMIGAETLSGTRRRMCGAYGGGGGRRSEGILESSLGAEK